MTPSPYLATGAHCRESICGSASGPNNSAARRPVGAMHTIVWLLRRHAEEPLPELPPDQWSATSPQVRSHPCEVASHASDRGPAVSYTGCCRHSSWTSAPWWHVCRAFQCTGSWGSQSSTAPTLRRKPWHLTTTSNQTPRGSQAGSKARLSSSLSRLRHKVQQARELMHPHQQAVQMLGCNRVQQQPRPSLQAPICMHGLSKLEPRLILYRRQACQPKALQALQAYLQPAQHPHLVMCHTRRVRHKQQGYSLLKMQSLMRCWLCPLCQVSQVSSKDTMSSHLPASMMTPLRHFSRRCKHTMHASRSLQIEAATRERVYTHKRPLI